MSNNRLGLIARSKLCSKRWIEILAGLSVLLFTGIVLHAGPTEIEAPVTAVNSSGSSKAITFPFYYTGEGLANVVGGYKRGAIYEGLLSVGVQGDLAKLAGWKGASFLVSAIYAHGSSLTNEFTHDFNGVSNIDAHDSVRLYETWLQQEFQDGKVSIRIGQLLADTEFFVSDNGALFINGAFGAIPVVSQNFDTPVYPVAAPGIRVRVSPNDAFSVQAAVYSGDAGDQVASNQHGTTWKLGDQDGVFALAEVAYKLNAGKCDTGLRGVYKLGAFYHSGEFNDLQTLSGSHAGDFGGYFVMDQQLWRKPDCEDQGLGGFLRIGGAPVDRNTVPFYSDAGFNYTGLISGRKQDVAGVAFSYTSLSHSRREVSAQEFTSHHETILEVTYKAVVKEWLCVQPDFQYLFTPGGDRSANGAFVVGLRFNLCFP